jgi:hypothetical protein
MKITYLDQSDVLYGTVGIGNLPPSRVTQRIKQITDTLQRVFTNEIILVAVTDDSPLELEIIRRVI